MTLKEMLKGARRDLADNVPRGSNQSWSWGFRNHAKAFVTENCVVASGTYPAERHRFNSEPASLAVLMIPRTFQKRKPSWIVSPALVENEHLMASLDWTPSGEPRPVPELVQLFVVFSPVAHKDLKCVQSRYPTLSKFQAPEL